MNEAEDLPGLFAEALELAPDERQRLLARLRATSPGRASRLAQLLDAAARQGSLLDRPAPGLEEVLGEAPTRVGAYRIVREIGRGGMGRVFLAEQEAEDFRRPVALKLIDRSQLAGDRVRRFRDEVRILAGLEHPGIARFLDGGRAADGTWFLALEYVEGSDLLAYCRQHDLGVRERVRLFLPVLDAVAYAHSRGVVHRDLKPDNILVGADGRPRLLDFGISKLVEPDVPDLVVTRTESRVFTPAYASPEQFRGERATPASDVFSLGVVLYELLSGTRPFGGATASPIELQAAVLSGDPRPPSAAARRATTTRRTTGGASAAVVPSGRLGRDLDAICLRALRPDPGQRYASAAAFAADLGAYLEGRPVAARRGGLRYRAVRLLRRHAARLTVSAALALALTALAAATWRLRQLHPEPPPSAFPLAGAAVEPIEALERDFAQHPASVEAGAALALAQSDRGRGAEASLTVARLRQIPGRADDPLIDYVDGVLAGDRREYQSSLVLQTRALDRALATGRGEILAEIRARRGSMLSELGRSDEARTEMGRARIAFLQAHDWASLGGVLNDLGILELRAGQIAKGERLLLAALRATRFAAPQGEHPREAVLLNNLAGAALAQGHPDIAADRLREAVALRRARGQRRFLGPDIGNYALALWNAGQAAAANAAVTESISLLRDAGDPSRLAFSLYYRAIFDLEGGRLDAVEGAIGEIREAARASADRRALGGAEELAGRLAALRNRVAEARRHFAEGRRVALAAASAESASDIDLEQARLELAAGDLAAASDAAERAAAPFRASPEPSATALAATALLAHVDALAGRLPDAARRLREIDPDGKSAERSPAIDQRLDFLAARAALARAAGRPSAARRDLEAAINAAGTAERTVRELDLRLDLAALDEAPAARRAAAEAIAREATSHGLAVIAERARRLAASRPRRQG